jgi:hypothetical protein
VDVPTAPDILHPKKTGVGHEVDVAADGGRVR